MQATRNRARSSGGTTARVSERELVESIFESKGLPGWLGWGTMGAESSYGRNNPGNTHYFGLIESSYAGGTPNGELAHDAQISAQLYSELVKQYGSLVAAVPHYSGNNYTLSHVAALGKGSAGGQGRMVDASFLEHLGEMLINPLAGPLGFGAEHENEKGPLRKGGESVLSGISSLSGLIELITSGEFWLRALEVVGGGILLIVAIKNLSAVDIPTPTAATVLPPV